MTTLSTRDFTYNDRTFRAEIVYDDDTCPWDDMTPLGDVSDWTRDAKGPGQIILVQDRSGHRRYYNFAQAVARGRAEGMSGERAAFAAQREYEYFRRWCNDDWHYVGVVVFPLTDRGDELRSYSDSLWGIESDATDHINEVALDLAYNIGLEVTA